MIYTSNKNDFGWGNKIPTPSPSNLTNGPISDHSVGQKQQLTRVKESFVRKLRQDIEQGKSQYRTA